MGFEAGWHLAGGGGVSGNAHILPPPVVASHAKDASDR